MLRRRFLSSVIFFSEAVASPIPHALFHHSSPVFSEATHTVKFLGIEKYFGKKPRILDSCPELEAQNAEENLMENDDINESEIKADLGLRKPIAEYGVNIRDRIRREYVAKGPCQPKGNIFQKTHQGKDNRSFRDAWYKDYD
ncbi:uncharacterized protein LOC121803492 [Salvia splendens]|uniref:uncharacterized protein LOC121803492 n=1 Tax=Salvia splendens TaxID=180675 RepID=UPI001C258CC9|nr:uncharacterized protein LOC121803492 [Salvia splendens]